MEKEQIWQEIKAILYGKGIMWTGCRCWWACINLWKKLSPTTKNELSLAEGDNHYWLQDKNGNIYDIYAELEGIDDYEYNIKRLIDIKGLKKDTAYDTKICTNSSTGKERMMNIYYLNI
jgi:hypothetical protein